MTATRIGRGATLLALAGAWLAAAFALTRTTVPAIDTGGLDVHRYFTSAQLARARRYERFVDVLWVLSVLATIATLVVLVRRARGIASGLELGPVSGGIVLGMVTLVALWFAQLPFGLVNHWWAHRHDLATGDYGAWLLGSWAQLGASAVYAMATIAIVIGLARRLGDRWWIAAVPVFAALVASLAFLAGWISVLDPKPMPQRLRDDVAQLERVEHVEGTAVRVEKVSDVTDEVNAFAIGMGPSTRVFLWDTLLDGRFSDREVRTVIAHELGHVRHRHIYKGVAWFALLSLPLAFAVARGTRRQGGMRDPAAVPLAVLVVVLFGLIATPFVNAVSRRYEAEADWSALEATHDPTAIEGVFRKLGTTSLAEPNPPLWAYVLLENHPTLAQRIAMAEQWQRRNGR